jgi:adenylate kinase family enzyme
MIQRLTKRGETSGRADDNVETIKKRLVTFNEQSVPVVEYFDKSGRLFKISSERAADDVFADVAKAFEAMQQ